MSMHRFATLFAVSLVAGWLTVPSFADSQARIVRLSQVDGDVQVDRNTGQGYEKAFLNLPVTQGTKLRTGTDSRAEIEFEDGTTLRLTPGTAVEFPELARRDSGGRSSNLELKSGTAYLNFKGDKQEQFTLGFGQEKLMLAKQAHLRIEMKDTNASVAVFKGEVDVDSPSGKVNVEKKHSASFDLAGSAPYTLANSLEPDPYDEWDKQQDQYQQRYSASNSFSPYSYGTSDMNYYGSFYTVPGYGMMWQPFLIGSDWDPYMNGVWSWYPGAGYTWVSSYPWGWTPYRYGSWTYLSSYGWFWQPGSTWAGWNTVPRIANAPASFSAPRPPSTPGQTLAVNRGTALGPVRVVQNRSDQKYQIRGGSAGLGVARGSIRDLGKVSQQIARTGSPGTGTMRSQPAASAMRLPPSASRGVAPRSGVATRSVGPSAGSAGGSAPRMSSGSGSSGSGSRGVSHR